MLQPKYRVLNMSEQCASLILFWLLLCYCKISNQYIYTPYLLYIWYYGWGTYVLWPSVWKCRYYSCCSVLAQTGSTSFIIFVVSLSPWPVKFSSLLCDCFPSLMCSSCVYCLPPPGVFKPCVLLLLCQTAVSSVLLSAFQLSLVFWFGTFTRFIGFLVLMIFAAVWLCFRIPSSIYDRDLSSSLVSLCANRGKYLNDRL